MWGKLISEELKTSVEDLGNDYDEFIRFYYWLTQREYSKQLFAYTSHSTIILTMAPSYQRQAGLDSIAIAFHPKTRLLNVSYREWISETRNPTHRVASSISGEVSESYNLLEAFILRLLTVGVPEDDCEENK